MTYKIWYQYTINHRVSTRTMVVEVDSLTQELAEDLAKSDLEKAQSECSEYIGVISIRRREVKFVKGKYYHIPDGSIGVAIPTSGHENLLIITPDGEELTVPFNLYCNDENFYRIDGYVKHKEL